MQGWFNICKSLNVIQHINRSKDKHHLIISMDAEKGFNQTQHHFMIKSQMKVGIEGMYLNIIRDIHHKPIASTILNGKKLRPFPLQSGMRLGCPLSPLLFNIVLEFLSRVIRQEEEIKIIQIGKEEDKLSLFTDDIILHLKDQRKLPRLHKQFQQSSRVQNQLTKISSFLYTNNEQIEKEYRKTTPFTIASKKN
jgi:hypothetical protein